MQQLLNMLDQGVFICTEEGKIIFANTKMLEIIQYEDVIIGEDISHYLTDFVPKETYGDNKIHVCKVNEKNGHTYEVTIKCEKGTYEEKQVWFLTMNHESKEERLIRQLLEGIRTEICIKDPQGKYVYINKAGAKRLNNEVEQVINKRDKDFFNPTLCNTFEKEDNHVRHTRKVSMIQEELLVGEEKKIYEVTKIPLETQEGVYVGVIMRDITLSENIQRQCLKTMEGASEIFDGMEYGKISQNLLELKETVKQYTHANAFNIWIYNDKKEVLMPYFKYEKMREAEEMVISKEEVANFLNGSYEKVTIYNETKIIQDDNQLKKIDQLQYHVCHPIIHDKKFYGLMCMGYESYPDNYVIRNYQIDNVSSKIGYILNKEELYKKLKKEWARRLAAEEELRLVLSVASDITVKLNMNGDKIYIGGKVDEILGWDQETFKHMALNESIYKDDFEQVSHMIDCVKKNHQKYMRTFRMKCRDGSYLWMNWIGIYIKEKDYMIFTGKDVTYQKQLEQKEQDINKLLEMESVKSEFLANVSHELKTPLTIILSTIQMIKEELKDDLIADSKASNLFKYIHMLQQNGYRLLRLVNNIVDITKMDAGYYTIKKSNLNIINLVEEITLSTVSYAKNKGIEVIFDTDTEEVVIACDPDKIERILLNLLSNAIKHTDKDGKIQVEISSGREVVNISVKDNGRGIPKHKLKNIFDRFVQVEDLMTRSCEGSGIGLSLVKALVQLHNGEVIAKSDYGKGTELIVQLPKQLIKHDESVCEHKNNEWGRVERCKIEFSDIYESTWL